MTKAARKPADIAALNAALARLGLLAPGERARYTALTGGVASDIWKVDTAAKTFAVKRALPKLKVATDWYVPVARNAFEVKWIEAVRAIMPQAVPQLLGHDPAAGFFAMAYLDPARYRNWKSELRDGRTDDAFAAAVGRCLVRIHAATAKNSAIATAFATDETFHAIRLAAYLEATASKHPEAADALMALSRSTLATKLTLVHGDVSPKNILIGPDGPIFLDAECAWYGDPAFDLAFCLNHMLLKCLWMRWAAARLLGLFDILAQSYLAGVNWESSGLMERRTARLLPGLFLARVDGKSPVEYVTAEGDKAQIRRVALNFLAQPPQRLSEVRNAWAREIGIKEPAA
jgi:aminoglycoside phosphotransferase (APT) family kinase protein